MELPLVGIVITLILSAFFSGLEIAYISSNRLKVELDKSKGTVSGKIIGTFYRNEAHFIAMLLLGNNVALVFFGLFSAEILEPIITVSWGITNGGVVLLLQTLISTSLVLIVAEFIPKALVQMNPNGYLKYTTYPMVIIYGLLYLPTYVILAFSTVILKLLKVDSDTKEKVFSKVDLEHYVQDINDRIKEDNITSGNIIEMANLPRGYDRGRKNTNEEANCVQQ